MLRLGEMTVQAERAILIVLDGFGIGKDSPFNAIKNAKMPFYRELVTKYPHSQLVTHGHAVGLPDGVMGNSEVGHMTMGAGEYLSGSHAHLQSHPRTAIFSPTPCSSRRSRPAPGKRAGSPHGPALGRRRSQPHRPSSGAAGSLPRAQGAERLGSLPFSTGATLLRIIVRVPRKTPAASGVSGHAQTRARIVSVMGRYFAMDRDKRWDRVEKAYKVLTGQAPAWPVRQTRRACRWPVRKSHEAGKSDEFVEPVLLEPDVRHAGWRQRDLLQLSLGSCARNQYGDDGARLSMSLTAATASSPRCMRAWRPYDKNLKNVGRRLRSAEHPQHHGRMARVASPQSVPHRRDRKVRPRDILLQRRPRSPLQRRGARAHRLTQGCGDL